ncbi:MULTISPECIES: hypothetical protein [Thermomonospora]|uniref:hypothetical protein n=1 Tax=Thermomonospora TaxID=2019 RepID=UPI0011D1EF0B|nr:MULTISPECIES: hypothetical protein [Thermomonospora]
MVITRLKNHHMVVPCIESFSVDAGLAGLRHEDGLGDVPGPVWAATNRCRMRRLLDWAITRSAGLRNRV